MAIEMLTAPDKIFSRNDSTRCRRRSSVPIRPDGNSPSAALSLRDRVARVLVFGGMAMCASLGYAQASPSPATKPAIDTATFMSRAMRQYNSGDYQASLDGFSQLLQVNPQDTTVRLFRALACGQLAVASERRALVARSQGRPEEAVEHERRAAQQYTSMRGDIDELVRGGLTNATAIVQLIDGVVQTKLAAYATGDYKERVAARADLLAHARKALEAYVHPARGERPGPNPLG